MGAIRVIAGQSLPTLKTRFIVNLRSGAAARALPEVEAFAARRGAEVTLTQHARHAFELATEALAAGAQLVVAVGGDGTMNEVASALVDTPATFGLVPCGSGNGLGRHLGIHGSTAHALALLEAGHTIRG
ncbi:MAG: acylglycerol kinase family protein [Verrucomicrobiota bacterium]